MILLDFQFREKLSFLEKINLKIKIIDISQKSNCDTIFTFGNKNNYMFKNILGYPFLNLPDKILPHGNPMFIHNFDVNDSKKLANINFTISDFDYF